MGFLGSRKCYMSARSETLSRLLTSAFVKGTVLHAWQHRIKFDGTYTASSLMGHLVIRVLFGSCFSLSLRLLSFAYYF